MFCKYCGKNITNASNFCIGCGEKIVRKSDLHNSTYDSQLELDFATMQQNVKIILQGVTPDLQRANGSFDEIDLGARSIYDLGNILRDLSFLTPYVPPNQSIEFCPVSLVVHAGENLYAFEVMNGSVLFSNENRIVTSQEAMVIVSDKNSFPQSDKTFSPSGKTTKDKSGNIHHSSSVWGSNHKDIKGLYPVRKPEIPPTDPVNTSAYTIKIQQSYSLNDRVIRSVYATGMYKAPLIFSIIPFALSIGSFIGDMIGFGLIMVLSTFLMFIISAVIWANSKDDIIYGFDWTQNAVFAKFSRSRKPSYLKNANCIIDFFVDLSVLESDRIQNIGGSTHIYTRVTDKNEYWYILARKTDGTSQSLIALFTQEDANRVCSNLNALLARQ